MLAHLIMLSIYIFLIKFCSDGVNLCCYFYACYILLFYIVLFSSYDLQADAGKTQNNEKVMKSSDAYIRNSVSHADKCI